MIEQDILDAFQLNGDIEKLKGGQENSYRVGDHVIKKNDGDNDNYEYIAHILSSMNNPHYRITKPVPSKYGTYVYKGYIVMKYEQGQHNDDNIKQLLKLSKWLRDDLKSFDIDHITQVDTQWAIAMDILFRERGFPSYVKREHKQQIEHLMRGVKRYTGDLQIIHGDMHANVIYHDTLPPCILDFSPNIAPAMMQEAIIVCDAIAWGGRDASIRTYLEDFDEYIDYLKYAVLFRMLAVACKTRATDEEFQDEYDAYMKVWNLLVKEST